jgi:soluble lytic murein transglycosylase
VWTELSERYIIPHLLQSGDTDGATAAYRALIARGRTGAAIGTALLATDGSWRTLLDVGRSDARSGRQTRAASHFERALALAPEGEKPAIAHALAETHRALGDHVRVLEVVEPWLDSPSTAAERRASMWLLAARSYAALGRTTTAAEAYEKAAMGSGNDAAVAAYLVADSHHDANRLEEAAAAYERSFNSFPSSSFGSRSLERMALLDFREGRYPEARTRLDLYRSRYPKGEWSQGAIYWTARALEAEGDSTAARTRYEEALRYNPLDYYGLLAGEKLARNPWDVVQVRDASPVAELAEEYAITVARMNHLRELGWTWRARWEYQAARERGPTDWAQIVAFAHALNANHWTQEGVAQGWRAKGQRAGWTRPMLEAIYPLPFPQALAHAARDRGLEPHFVAGLSRRESLFDPEIRSAADAIGLMQVLPTTARDVAPRAGLPEYQRSQLTVPQVNLLLGTRYLADVLARFGNNPIAGMISYNAGPHRYVRWREFPEFGDDETLVERIPFKETREYVRAVTELAEIYRFLYPELGATVP